MEPEKYLELIIKQRRGILSSEEESLLKHWLEESSEHTAIKDDLEKVWNITQHYQESYTPDVAAGLRKFQDTLSKNEELTEKPINEITGNQSTEPIIQHLQGRLSSADEAVLQSQLQQDEAVADLHKSTRQVWKITEQYQRSYTPDVAAGLARFQQTLAELALIEGNLATETSYSELIIKRLSNQISEEENSILDEWLATSPDNYQAFEELSQIWESTADYQKSYEPNAESGFARFQQLLGNEDENSVVETKESFKESKDTKVKPIAKRSRRNVGTLGIAAAVALLFVVGYFALFYNIGMVEIKTANSSKEITLPDGSKVSLNKNSVLTYNKKFENRVVKLSGEAFFEVTKQNGRSFSILSNDVKTEVLGTSFNVKAPDNQKVEVTVVTGKVAVSVEKTPEKKVLLTPGDKAVYQKQNAVIKKEKNTNQNFLSWKTNYLKYENRTLREILPELERHYNIKLKPENDAILNCRFTGEFKNITLQEAFDIIEFGLNTSFQKSGDEYIIKGKGCETN